MENTPENQSILPPHDREVVEHYVKYLGQLNNTFVFKDLPDVAPSPLFVLEFSPPGEGYSWVYATLGASRQPMPYPPTWKGPRTPRYSELVLLANEPDPRLAEVLAKLAVYPFFHGTFIAPGYTIAGDSAGGIVPGSPISDVLVTHPYFTHPDFITIEHHDKTQTMPLWIVPVYASEREFVRSYGVHELQKLFIDSAADTSNLFRDAVV